MPEITQQWGMFRREDVHYGLQLNRRRRWWADDNGTDDHAGGEPGGDGAGGGAENPQQQGTQITDLTELQNQLNAVRQEAAKYRTQLRETEKRLKQQQTNQQGQQSAGSGQDDATSTAQVIAQAVAEALNPLNQQLKTLQDQVSSVEKARHDAVRRNVQSSLGLTDELMARVQGDTEEEIRQDAERLLEAVRGLPGRGVSFSLGGQGGDDGGASAYAEQIFNQRAGKNRNNNPLVRGG